MKLFLRILATGFGSGLAPWAPGTFGSVAGLGFAYLFHYMMLALAGGSINHPTALLFGLIPATGIVVLAYWVIKKEEEVSAIHDASSTVIDEIAGISLALIWFTPHWLLYLLGFVLFRWLDIAKPSVIGWADRELPGAWGTLLDDLIAGVVVGLMLGSVYLAFPKLFV